MFHIGCKTYEDTQQELKNGGLVDDFPFPPKYLWGSKFVLQRCMMGDFYSNILRLEYSPLKLAVSSWKIPPRPFQKEIHRIPTIGIFWVAMLVYPKGSWEVGKMSHALARWAMPWLCTVVLWLCPVAKPRSIPGRILSHRWRGEVIWVMGFFVGFLLVWSVLDKSIFASLWHFWRKKTWWATANPFWLQVRHYRLKAVARRRKIFSAILLAYRLLAAILLVWVGTFFLVYTVDVTELILVCTCEALRTLLKDEHHDEDMSPFQFQVSLLDEDDGVNYQLLYSPSVRVFCVWRPDDPSTPSKSGEGFWMLWLLASYWTLMTCSSMPWPQHQDGTWSINWMPCPCQPCRAFAELMPNQCLGGCCPLAVRWNMLKQSFFLSMWLYSARNLQLSGSSFVAHLCTQSATDWIQAKHPLQ